MKCSWILLISLFILLIGNRKLNATEFSLSEKINENEKKIEVSLQELADTRKSILESKIPLAKSLSETINETNLQKQKWKILQTDFKLYDRNLAELETELIQLRNQIMISKSLLQEFALESLPIISEKKVDPESKQNSKEMTTPQQLISLLNQAELKNKNYLIPRVLQKECLDFQGTVHKGRVAQFGPIGFFLNDQIKIAGIIDITSTSETIHLKLDLDPLQVKTLFDGQKVNLPIDVTGGMAIKAKEFEHSHFDHLKKGGFTMIPILFLGLLSLLVAFWKYFYLLSIKKCKSSHIRTFVLQIKEGKIPPSDETKKKLGPILTTILSTAKDHKEVTREHMEEVMFERSLAITTKLEKGLGLLSVTASVAPLLGLLGTVTGMIHTFNLVTLFGTGKAELLSSGISEALITTEYGLIVAIPIFIFHAILQKRVKDILQSIEESTLTFINTWYEKPQGN